MKKMIAVFSLVILVSLVVTSNIMAFTFIDVDGFVNSNVGSVTHNSDGSTTFSQVDYRFRVTGASMDAKMDWLGLSFPKDVYQFVGIEPDEINISNLSHDWSTSSGPLINDIFVVAEAGTPIAENDTFAFSVMNVTVLDQLMWKGSHYPFIQSFGWSDTKAPGWYDTTTPTPEPGTFLLLGSGLAGVVAYVRKKKCLLNI